MKNIETSLVPGLPVISISIFQPHGVVTKNWKGTKPMKLLPDVLRKLTCWNEQFSNTDIVIRNKNNLQCQ